MVTHKRYMITFGILTLAVLAFLCSISNVLFPFVVSLIIAYFLHPVVTRIHACGISRTLATSFILSLFFIVLGLLTLLLAPSIYHELSTLVTELPGYVTLAKEELLPEISRFLRHFSPDILSQIMTSLSDVSSYFITFLVDVSKNIWNSGMTLLNVLSLIFITPLVTFYILRDWNYIVTTIRRLLPPKYLPTIQEQLSRIDHTLSGYLRGQINVCLCMAVFYTISLFSIGLHFALVVGITSGLLTFIPYIGVVFGLTVSLLIAAFQFSDPLSLGLVIGIFILGQMIEGMFITPKLIGSKIGLHPVWIIFALLAGGSLFGFTGMLLAIPVSAVIGVLIRFSIEQYLASSLFRTKKQTTKPDTSS